MPDCMRNLAASGLEPALRRALASKPVLAICIGEQMLFERTEEGDAAGLGLFPGQVVKRFARSEKDAHGKRLKVPHMGWNRSDANTSRTRCGRAWPTPAAFISFTATMS